ncbi:hypothetical protein AZI86_05025 [Bdellovibrio bacteriovorus]|uniref:DUF1993 domain-containing protein n=1 Tax=Bdellovibrio bacteriovorus TaxID=959 RepID=A0A150WQ09_BDEBC|nr:DUF1993 domain-containing protein [Bdellovibrio bacteriovorus]KYG66414.1 hypothetical protein AZI86_05025 [Bdellovibrio bacteriovorus]
MTYEMTNVQCINILTNLLGFLDKAAAYADHKKFDFEVLMQSRLAPDQFPLARQIQIACDTAKLGAFRLTGKEAPSHADTEKTLPEIRQRIESTVNYLKTLSAKDYEGFASRKITQPRWEGKYLMGDDYMIHHLIPNFYFHITTAYAILRHNGVDLGKGDFLGTLPFKK